MNVTIKSGLSIVTVAALMAVASAALIKPVSATEQEQSGRCYGVNNCKGASLCATAKNDCKGLNSCKGKGVVVRTKSACLAAGGTLTEPK